MFHRTLSKCHLSQREIKDPHTPAGVFHMAKPYFTHVVHFTNPTRDLFHWGIFPYTHCIPRMRYIACEEIEAWVVDSSTNIFFLPSERQIQSQLRQLDSQCVPDGLNKKDHPSSYGAPSGIRNTRTLIVALRPTAYRGCGILPARRLKSASIISLTNKKTP